MLPIIASVVKDVFLNPFAELGVVTPKEVFSRFGEMAVNEIHEEMHGVKLKPVSANRKNINSTSTTKPHIQSLIAGCGEVFIKNEREMYIKNHDEWIENVNTPDYIAKNSSVMKLTDPTPYELSVGDTEDQNYPWREKWLEYQNPETSIAEKCEIFARFVRGAVKITNMTAAWILKHATGHKTVLIAHNA